MTYVRFHHESRHPSVAIEDNREGPYQDQRAEFAFDRFDAYDTPVNVVMEKSPV